MTSLTTRTLRFSPRLAAKRNSPVTITMSSTARPVRSTRLMALQAPSLPEIMSRIETQEDNVYELIREECERVSKYYKQDTDQIASFWLDYYIYHFDNDHHTLILQYLLATLGLKQSLVVRLLDDIPDKKILRQLGVVRCSRNGTTYYRILIGE